MTFQTCMRCGFEGHDVSVALVDLEREAQADGGRVRDVTIRHDELGIVFDDRALASGAVTVPERYGAEYRCRDREACDRRLAAQQVTSDEGEEATSWI